MNGVCSRFDIEAVEAATAHVHGLTGIERQVGVGYGLTADTAGKDAKFALERSRTQGVTIGGADALLAEER